MDARQKLVSTFERFKNGAHTVGVSSNTNPPLAPAGVSFPVKDPTAAFKAEIDKLAGKLKAL